jgi:hypothetical protein
VASCRLVYTRYHDGLAMVLEMTSEVIGMLQVQVADESKRAHESNTISWELAKTDLVLIHRTPPYADLRAVPRFDATAHRIFPVQRLDQLSGPVGQQFALDVSLV